MSSIVSRMRRAAVSNGGKKQRSAVQPHEHWRAAARREFPAHEEFASSDDEEYGIYNLFFQLRGELTEAIAKNDVERASKIIDFAARCLRGALVSDGEDIGVAAGVSLFEHVFEDSPRKWWPVIFSAMPRSVYSGCRHYVEQWMDRAAFSKLDQDATRYYG